MCYKCASILPITVALGESNCLESQIRGFEANSDLQVVLTIQNVSLLSCSLVKIQYCGSLRVRGSLLGPQSVRAQISNPVFGGQCHFIHITILRWFYCHCLAYM